MSNEIQHTDKLGQILHAGDCVAFPYHNGLEIGIVVKLNPKMVKVKKVEPSKRWQPTTWNKYSHDVVKLEGPIILMYIIKNSGGK